MTVTSAAWFICLRSSRRTFKIGDSDGNGNSTAEELTQGTMHMGEETADEEVDVAVCLPDVGGDGQGYHGGCEGAERAAAGSGRR